MDYRGLTIRFPLWVRVPAIIGVVLVGAVASAMLIGAAGVSGGHSLAPAGVQGADHNGAQTEATVPSESPAATGSTLSTIPLISVSGGDYSFDAPDTIADGLTTLRFSNGGKEDHELHLMRLNEGVVIHQFMQTLHQEGLDIALELGEERGHVATVGPGQTAETMVDLPEGEYALVCKVPSPDDGVAHALKGMVKQLTVTASP